MSKYLTLQLKSYMCSNIPNFLFKLLVLYGDHFMVKFILYNVLIWLITYI